MTNNKTGRVEIGYGVVVNACTLSGGWLPVYTVNGRQYGNTYSRHGLDKADAISAARSAAQEEACKYIGDWEVSVNAVR
jgi:hypothetical protein